MIQVSSAWRAAMESDTYYTTRAVITLADGSVLNVDADDIAVTGNSFTDGPSAAAFPVGAAMSRTMQISLDNSDERYAGTDFFGAVIRLYLVYGGEEITVGRFTVRQPETCGDTVLITAQDDMYRADRPFTTALTYPASAASLWREICASCGITDGMTGGGLPAFAIPEAPSSDLTCRQVLGYIAMLAAGNARINRLGNLEIVNYDFAGLDILEGSRETDGDVHDLTMWRSLRVDTEDVTITGIQTAVYSGEESSTVLVGTDDYVLTLTNPLFKGRENAALTTIYNALAGHPFRGFSGEYIAYPLAEFGDLCRITDRRGRVYYSVITDVAFAWGRPTALSNSAESPLRAGTVYAKETVGTLQRASQMVAAEATARANAVTALQNALATAGGLYETTQSDGSGGTIYLFHDKPTLAASDIVIRITAEAVGISTDGGATYATGFNFATSTAVLGVLQAFGVNADWITAGSLTVADANGHVIFSAGKDSKTVQLGGMSAAWDSTYDTLYVLSGDCALRLESATLDGYSDYDVRIVYGSNGIELYRGESPVYDPDTGEMISGGWTLCGRIYAMSFGATGAQLNVVSEGPLNFVVPSAGDFVVYPGTGSAQYARRPLNEIGTLSGLNTTDKSSLVDAVNEVNGKITEISTVVCTLLGALIGISTANYYQGGDGE